MSLRIRYLAIAMSFCIYSVCNADQFGNVIYVTPEGWSRVQQGDSMLLIPGDVPGQFVFTLAIAKGGELNARTLMQFMKDTLRTELSTGATVLSAAPVDESKIASGVPVLSTTRVMATREGVHFLAAYFVLQAGSRGEVVTVISNSEEVVRKYSDAVGQFIATLQFANVRNLPPAAKAPAAKGNARIDGLYVHLTRSPDKRPVRGEGLLFYLDGRVYRGIPTGGLDSFDWDQAFNTLPSTTGHYVLNKKGNEATLSFEWMDGTRDEQNIHFTDLGYASGPDNWERASKASAGRIAGKWEAIHPTDPAVTATETISRLEFRADGTFSSAGINGNAKVEAKGKFMIDGFSIQFVTDKSTRVFTFFAYPGDPLVIHIDGADFIYQNKK